MAYSNPKILSYHTSHNASVCYLKDGKIEWMLEEERNTRRKHDHRPYTVISKYVEEAVDWILHSSLIYPDQIEDTDTIMAICNDVIAKATNKSKKKRSKRYSVKDNGHIIAQWVNPGEDLTEFSECSEQHHLYHAALGFYNSGFKEASVLVVDGAGAWIEKCGHEVETIYKASYPHTFEKISQGAVPWHTLMDRHTIKDPTSGIGMVYSGVSAFLGFGTLECGKLMGLSTYGKEDPNIKPFVVDGRVDESLWVRDKHGIELISYDYIDDRTEWIKLLNGESYDLDKCQHLCNLAWRCQKDFENYMLALIKKALEHSNNVVLTGGCALNCVANYEYLKHLPEGAKLYVEPISSDAGISIGMAMHCWRHLTESMDINPIETLYLGPEHEILL